MKGVAGFRRMYPFISIDARIKIHYFISNGKENTFVRCVLFSLTFYFILFHQFVDFYQSNKATASDAIKYDPEN